MNTLQQAEKWRAEAFVLSWNGTDFPLVGNCRGHYYGLLLCVCYKPSYAPRRKDRAICTLLGSKCKCDKVPPMDNIIVLLLGMKAGWITPLYFYPLSLKHPLSCHCQKKNTRQKGQLIWPSTGIPMLLLLHVTVFWALIWSYLKG